MLKIVLKRIVNIGLLPTLSISLKRLVSVVVNCRRMTFRQCRCCQRSSVFVPTLDSDEGKRCCWCGANRRYEMLAECILSEGGSKIESLRVVELDPDSPLQPILSRAKQYTQTYYKADVDLGTLDKAGKRCEDVTAMTFDDGSVDLLVSSEVLEHVPDLHQAFRETARVLSPEGVHLFTVPTSRRTLCRARINDGRIIHEAEPEYHLDPLDPKGILAFWAIGTDLPFCIQVPGLVITRLRGPEGPDNRVVWAARKTKIREHAGKIMSTAQVPTD
jgi:SAM-dependent methyltransferase